MTAAACALSYAGYLTWLAAGCADFLCHRRTDLPHTSGLRESALHLAQLALMGAGFALGMALSPSWMVCALLGVVVAVHAAVGYLDTRQAYGRRPITPFEQHMHSVLDMAPVFALVLYCGLATHRGATMTFALRDPPLAPSVWAVVVMPALVLVMVPALMEFRAACRVARGGG